MKKLLLLGLFLVGLTSIRSSGQCVNVNSAFFSNPSGDGQTFSLTINWTAQGTNHLVAYVMSGPDTIYTTCVQVSGSGSGTSVYEGIVSPGGLPTLSASFTRWTGPCDRGFKCGPDQIIPPGGVLNLKFEWIRAKYISQTTTEVTFKAANGSTEKSVTVNLRMKSGNIKKYQVQLPREIKTGEVWVITLNHATGTNTIVKL